MRINHNIQALNAYRNLSKNQNVISKHMERLSSGLRINHASDDAAGLAISEKMRTQIRGLQAAERNTMDGISLVQTAEGALDSVQAMLQRMRELAVQAANDTSTESDRKAIQDEINQLTSEINRVGNSIEFNSQKLLDGSISSTNFSGTGRLKGGADEIVGAFAKGTINIGSETVTATAVQSGTDLNGYKIVFGVDNNDPGTALKSANQTYGTAPNDWELTITPLSGDSALAGVTFTFVDGTPASVSGSGSPLSITVTADLANANLGDLENAINEYLNTNALGKVALTSSTATPTLTDLDSAAPTNAPGLTMGTATTNVKATVTGRTITVTGDWDNSAGFAPTNLKEIEAAINIALRAEGRGEITLSSTAATFSAADFKDAGEIGLMGGIKGVEAKAAKQIISVNSKPNEKDILVINGIRIGFWDSSKSTYGNGSIAETELGVQYAINIFDGHKYKESHEIASEIVALHLNNPFPNVDIQLSEAGSDLIITATNAGPVGNNIRTDYLPTMDSGLNLQIGANTGQKLVVDIPNVRAQALKISGITSGGKILSADGKTEAFLTQMKTVNNGLNAELVEYAIDVSTHEHAAAAITIFEDALNRVSAARSGLGAYQNRLEYTASNLAQTAENVTAAESRIRDADMAYEMTNFTKNNIITQAAQAMLAQANQLPQGILQLLK